MVYTIACNDVGVTRVETGSSWKQFVFALFASLPFFTHGIESTCLTTSAHAGHFISSNDVLWTNTAAVLGALVSAPIYCYVIDKCGRKIGIFIISLMQGASLVPLFLPPNETNALILHSLAGISSGGLFTVLPIYIREISDDSNRGLTVSFMLMMTTAGYLLKLATSSEIIMYVMVGLVMVQLLSLTVLVESPSYMVMDGKDESAKKYIAKLKCIPDDNPNVSNELKNLKDESERAKSNGKLTVIGIIKNVIYRDGTKIGLILYTVTVLGGSIIFLDQQKSLIQLKLTSDPENMLVLLCLFSGSLITVLVIKFIDRKYILTFAYILMVLSMGVLAVFTQSDLTVTSLRWLPVVSLGILVISYGMAWGLPCVIMVEMLNFEIRATVMGVIYAYSQILKLAQVHSFKYIEDYVGIYTLLYIFCMVNLYGVVYSLFAIPNIKNKTVRQIERQLKRIPLLKFNVR